MSPSLTELATSDVGADPDDVSSTTPTSSPSDSTPADEWDGRPTTGGIGCDPEPLDDSVTDCYSLFEPIADDVGLVADDRYLGDDGEPLSHFEAVGSYIERRHGANVSAEKHGFHKTRQWRQIRNYARGKEMDRQLLDGFSNPTLVMLSLRMSPTVDGRLTLLSALHDARESTLYRLRRRLQHDADAPFTGDEWEYFDVIAGTKSRATPHIHLCVYTDGDVARKRFKPVVRTFVDECRFAPDDMRGNSAEGGVISIRGNGDDVVPRMDDAPEESQAGTYVLSQLPHLADVDEMARDELLHSVTCDALPAHAFHKSGYTVWDDADDGPEPDDVSGVNPTLSATTTATADIEPNGAPLSTGMQPAGRAGASA